MCITFVKISKSGKHKILIGFNREVEITKPTDSVGYWPDDQNILGGMDLVMKGSCLAINVHTGHFAILTNYSELPVEEKYRFGKKSRGDLVRNFVCSNFYEINKSSPSTAAHDYLSSIPLIREQYNPFNMMVGNIKDPELKFYAVDYLSKEPFEIPHDIFFGMSNSCFAEPYLKLEKGLEFLNNKQDGQMEDLAKIEICMADKTNYNRGVPFDPEDSILVEPFSARGRAIVVGTITSTIIAVDSSNRFSFKENRFLFPHVKSNCDQSVDKKRKLRRVLNKIKALFHMVKAQKFETSIETTEITGVFSK